MKGTIAIKIEMVPERDAGYAPTLEPFSDAYFAADKKDRKSITGCVVRLNGMVVSWCAKKQGGFTLSTMEAEFVAASEVARELLGIREMLREIGMEPALPMAMRIDTRASICHINGEATSTKAKHIDVRLKFICDYARRGGIEAQHVRSELMMADLLTKVVDPPKMATLRGLLRIG